MTKKAQEDAPAAPDVKTTAEEIQPLAEEVRKAMNIHQRMVAIMGEIGIVEKGGRNTEQNYAFIEYAAVAGKLRILFDKYGVLIIPKMAKLADHVRTEVVTSNGRKGVALLVPFVFDVVNVDKPDDHFEVDWVGEAIEYGDKGTNKAATSALKYYMMRQFNISEKGEQEADAASPDRGTANNNQSRQQYPPRQNAPAAKPALPARPANAAMDDVERAALFAAMLKVGIDTKDEQLELLRVNGITDPKSMSSGMAKTMLNKLTNKTFARPASSNEDDTPPATEDTVIDDISDEPVNLDDIPDDFGKPDPETPPAEQRVMTEEVVHEIGDKLNSLGLSTWGVNHFLRDTVGTPFIKKLKSEDWRKIERRVDAVLNAEEELPDTWFAGVEGSEGEGDDDQGGENADLFTEPNRPDDDGDAQAGTFDPPIAETPPSVPALEDKEAELPPEMPIEKVDPPVVVDDDFKEKIAEDMKAKGIVGAERLRMLRQCDAISFKQMKQDDQWLKLRSLVDIHEGNTEDAK